MAETIYLKSKKERDEEYQKELLEICQVGTYLYFTYEKKLVEYIKYIKETNKHVIYVINDNNEKVKETILIEPQTQIACGLEMIENYLQTTIKENEEQINFVKNGGPFKDINRFKAECYEKHIKAAEDFFEKNKEKTKANELDYDNYKLILKIYPKKKEYYMKKYEENREIMIEHLIEETSSLKNDYKKVISILNRRKPLNGN